MQIKTINPATEEVIATYDLMTDNQVNTVLSNSYKESEAWAGVNYQQRAELLKKIADLLLQRKEEYARLISIEMGKPIAQARAEIDKCGWGLEHYAEHAEDYLKDYKIDTAEARSSIVIHKPLGVIFAIMPWNFPFWQVVRFAAPSIMAGNTVIIKHADNCTGISLAIEQLFIDAGAPKNLLKCLIISHEQAANVISSKYIAAVTLTGSDRAGRQVASLAGSHLKKTVLELGGNDPYIILADADLELAAEMCIKSRLNNTGQVCIAAKRIIIIDTIAEKFKKIVLDKIKNYKIGNPLDESNHLGPLARKDLRDNLHSQVQRSIEQGAELLYGPLEQEYINKYANKAGYFHPIIVLDNISKDMSAYNEELFGPCFCFISAKNTDEAIHIANDSQYGLSAAIFTKNIELAQDIAINKIKTGTVAINNMVSSDPRVPFGGTKNSGYGRELGREGILEFVNIKTVSL